MPFHNDHTSPQRMLGMVIMAADAHSVNPTTIPESLQHIVMNYTPGRRRARSEVVASGTGVWRTQAPEVRHTYEVRCPGGEYQSPYRWRVAHDGRLRARGQVTEAVPVPTLDDLPESRIFRTTSSPRGTVSARVRLYAYDAWAEISGVPGVLRDAARDYLSRRYRWTSVRDGIPLEPEALGEYARAATPQDIEAAIDAVWGFRPRLDETGAPPLHLTRMLISSKATVGQVGLLTRNPETLLTVAEIHDFRDTWMPKISEAHAAEVEGRRWRQPQGEVG